MVDKSLKINQLVLYQKLKIVTKIIFKKKETNKNNKSNVELE